MSEEKKPDEDKSLIIAYKSVFGTPDGERVLTDILTSGFVFDAVHYADPILSARGEGARALALRIARYVGLDLKFFRRKQEDSAHVSHFEL